MVEVSVPLGNFEGSPVTSYGRLGIFMNTKYRFDVTLLRDHDVLFRYYNINSNQTTDYAVNKPLNLR